MIISASFVFFAGSYSNLWHGSQRAFLWALPRLYFGVSDPSPPLQCPENQKHAKPKPRRSLSSCSIVTAHCEHCSPLCEICYQARTKTYPYLLSAQTSISWSPLAAWWFAPRSSSLRCRRLSSSARCAPSAPAWRWIVGASLSRLCVATATPPTVWRSFTTARSFQTNRWWAFGWGWQWVALLPVTEI